MSDDDTTATSSKRRPFLKAGAGAVAVSLAGCTGDEGGEGTETEPQGTEEITESTPEEVGEGDVPEGGSFRFGMSNPPEGVNPMATSSSYSWTVLSEIMGYGTALDPVTFDVHPSAYTDWTVENVDSGEPDVYFNIREGITWSDGEEFTVDDVLFTYNFIMEANPGRYASTIAPVETVEEADNDWDVHLKLANPVGTYDSQQLQLPLLPEHRWSDVSPENFTEYQPQENTYEVDGQEYLGPVGLGPGRLTRYEPDTSVEIEYRDDYTLNDLEWYQEHENLRAGGPFLDNVRFNIYGSSDALQQAFISEDAIDALYGSVLPANIPDVEEKEGARIVTGSDTGYAHYSFEMRTTPFDDTIFRQAVGLVYDHIYWIDQLNRGTVQRGAFTMPPGYTAVRPETEIDAEINEHPASKAFDFLEDQPGVPDYAAIKDFLRGGVPITGEAAEGDNQVIPGRDYPGSMTGVTTDDMEARHEYTWGSVESDILADEPGVEEEIRVNGETITEINGQPLQILMYPPQDSPLGTQMLEDWVSKLKALGIPVERNVMTFNTMLTEVYTNVNFGAFPMSWTNLSPFAAPSLEALFHSSQAHSPDEIGETDANNAMGYGTEGLPGADDLIDEALQTMDTEERNSVARQVVEKIYLDAPSQINSHEIPQWPVNEADFEGYVSGIPSPGDSYVSVQFSQIHQAE